MKTGMPSPAINYIPKQFSDDLSGQALAAMLDVFIQQMYSDTLGLRDRYSPESCPSGLLEELAKTIGVNTFTTDSQAQLRARITSGVRNQSYKSLWMQDAFLRIKNITGVDPLLYVYRRLDDCTWAFMADQSTPLTYASLGDGVNYGGLDIEGAGTEVSFAGNVYIDIGAGESPEQVARIVAELKDYVCPAYYYITLGYMSGTDFVPYAGGFF